YTTRVESHPTPTHTLTLTLRRYGIQFFLSSRRRHTIFKCDWSSDVCSSDLKEAAVFVLGWLWCVSVRVCVCVCVCVFELGWLWCVCVCELSSSLLRSLSALLT